MSVDSPKMRTDPAPRQRALQREATRRQLVQAGLRVVADSGFVGASTAAIARATGKAHGTVFVHFPTRDALVAELVAEVGRVMSARLMALETAAPTVAEVLQAHLTALAENEVLYARMLCEASSLPVAARAHVFALQSGVVARLQAAYERERAMGLLRKLDLTTLGTVWIGLSNHYLLNRDLFAPDGSVVARCGALIKAQFLELLQPHQEPA
jgi:AcrR family transcriptional regulator